MDQAKVIININEGIIQLEGPVEFVLHYLEKYAPAVKGLSASEPKADVSEQRGKARGRQRSCSRAIRAEIKAGFFDSPRSTQAVRSRLTEKGVACSSGVLRTSLRKVIEEGRLETAGKGRDPFIPFPRGRGSVFERGALPLSQENCLPRLLLGAGDQGVRSLIG